MTAKERRSIPSPCVICTEPISNSQEVVFCPDCGEPYHNDKKPSDCWKRVGRRCRVRGCKGRIYPVWLKVERSFLQSLGIRRTKLVSYCPNCGASCSALYRYCTICGYEINRPALRRTFFAYAPAKWIHRNHRIILAMSSIVSVLFLCLGASYVAMAIQNHARQRPAAVLVNASTTPAPRLTSAPRPTSPSVSTPTRPKPTKTPVPRQSPTPVTSCPGAPEQQVEVGGKAWVCTKSDRLIVRQQPRLGGQEITRLEPGTHVSVVDGPRCANSHSWWKIRTETGIVGWVAEGSDEIDPYFICPLK